jgi:hypothetical protein
MTERMNQYICGRLPKLFESFQTQRLSNKSYEEQMQREQETFIHSFLKKAQYYYAAASEKFFVYDGVSYSVVSEDDILQNVLSSISKNRALIPWKKSTKVHIMAKIKASSLLKAIPNSETIQSVLDLLYPAIFSKKTEAKYFLTVIGDALFKKSTDLIHFVNAKAKSFLRELNNLCQIYLGANVTNTFKHKYHEHDYTLSRLLRISDGTGNENIWRPIIGSYFLDMICVAAHYSIRFSSSDEYISEASNDDALSQYVFYLRDHQTPQKVVSDFLSLYVERKEGQTISWKNMLFLWKHFLTKHELPAIIFQNNLKQMLVQLCISKMAPSPPVCNSFAAYMADHEQRAPNSLLDIIKNVEYDESADAFIGLSSKYMPAIQSFLQFWSDTMILSDSEYDLELGELVVLFKRFCFQSGIVTNTMSELQLLEMVTYYYPDIVVEDRKYIHGVLCRSWNKKEDIEDALEALRTYEYENNAYVSHITFYEAYQFYCKHQRMTEPAGLIVSKNYFEKYLVDNLAEYIIDDAMISCDWISP